MRALIFIATAIVLTATPSFAQASRGYIEGAGGFVVGPDSVRTELARIGGELQDFYA